MDRTRVLFQVVLMVGLFAFLGMFAYSLEDVQACGKIQKYINNESFCAACDIILEKTGRGVSSPYAVNLTYLNGSPIVTTHP